jgi:predicted ABC-type transport system involved in lysophospholipase L1 biosynthesis ATPase subunit
MSALLRAADLARSFQVGRNRIDVLRGVSLGISAAQRVFLCGPSGAGKTTLLYILAGLDRPNAGSVHLDATSLYGLPDADLARTRNRRMGYVFQSYLLLPELTALENVALPSLIGGKVAKDRARQLLEKVGLGHRLDHLPFELSGGEQQRCAIARALINDPVLLFADEPTGNLDSKTGREVMDLLLGLATAEGKTLIIVTHDTHLAEQGDRRITLADGVIVEDTAPLPD